MLKFFNCSLRLEPRGLLKNICVFCSPRCYCYDSNKVKKVEEDKFLSPFKSSSSVELKVWNERAAVKRLRKKSKFRYNVSNIVDLMSKLQSIQGLPCSIKEWYGFFKRKIENTQLIEQKYLPERVAILKPDLAVAHFLIGRGGSVKFKGKSEWMGKKGAKPYLPNTYVPGYSIEALDAEETDIIYEGLPNIGSLDHLTSLFLKGSEGINDWCLDWISKEYHTQLQHLDISGCKNVTYRGLSCFYRFECLKTLNVKDITDAPEFKLACIMLQDIMPDLEIQGIDLSVPVKLDPVKPDEVKSIFPE